MFSNFQLATQTLDMFSSVRLNTDHLMSRADFDESKVIIIRVIITEVIIIVVIIIRVIIIVIIIRVIIIIIIIRVLL